MFAGINRFWAWVRLILAWASWQGLKGALKRAQNMFMPNNINFITMSLSLCRALMKQIEKGRNRGRRQTRIYFSLTNTAKKWPKHCSFLYNFDMWREWNTKVLNVVHTLRTKRVRSKRSPWITLVKKTCAWTRHHEVESNRFKEPTGLGWI